MPFSKKQLELAYSRKTQLANLITTRKQLETQWLSNKETIFQPTTIHFTDIFGKTLLDYSVLLSDLESVKTLIEQGAVCTSKTQRMAEISNNKEIIDCLKLSPTQTVKVHKPSASLAGDLCNGNFEAIKKYLLEHQSFDLEEPIHMGKNALMYAVCSDNVELIQFLIQQNNDPGYTDWFGNTVLHQVAIIKDMQIIKLFLNHEHYKGLVDTQNIYGQTPYQIALNDENRTFIKTFKKTCLDKNLKNKAAEPPIHQAYLQKKLTHYQLLFNQDPSLFSKGSCNGFSFLKLYYTSLGKRDEFFKILEQVSRWDGQYDSLYQKPPGSLVFSAGYKNVHELFRQLCNDLLWFQMAIPQELKPLNWSQSDRASQYSLLRSKKDDKSFQFQTHLHLYGTVTEAQLAEYISILTKYPRAMIEFSYHSHKTCLYARSSTQLDFYDSNDIYPLVPFTNGQKLAQYINRRRSSLIEMKSKEELKKIPDMTLYVFTHESPTSVFYYFHQSELIQFNTEQAIVEFQTKSPNGMTPLHLAVLTGSYANVVSLLKKPLQGGLNQVNAQGLTPVDLAAQLKRQTILNLFFESKNFNINDHSVLSVLYEMSLTNSRNSKVLSKLIESPTLTRTNGLLNKATACGDIQMITTLLKKNISPMEHHVVQDLKSPYPLFTAIDEYPKNGLRPLKLLLKNQLDLSATNQQGLTVLDYAIQLNVSAVLKAIREELSYRSSRKNNYKTSIFYSEKPEDKDKSDSPNCFMDPDTFQNK